MLRSVLSIAAFISISISFGACSGISPTRSKEAILRQNLRTLRDQINNYTQDKEKAPQTLQDLVDAGYLKRIPKDPFTDSAQTWQVEKSDALISVEQTEPGISDVHSGSHLIGSDRTPYNSW